MRSALVLWLLTGALLAQSGNAFSRSKAIVGRVWLGRASGGHIQVNLETSYGTVIASTYSDPDGRFSFHDLSGGVYQVSAAASGFQPLTQTVNLGDTGDEAEVSLFLHAASNVTARPVNPLSSPSLQKKALASYQKGRALLDAKKYSQAIGPLTETVAAAPMSAIAYNDLGSAYYGNRKVNEAQRSWQQALRIDPHFAPSAINLARIENDKKHWSAALKLLQTAAASPKGDTWPMHLERARAEYGEQQWVPAFQDLNQALQLGGGDKWPQIYALRANLFVRAGRYPEARQDFETYLKLEPKGTLSSQTRQIVRDMIAHGVPEPAPAPHP